MFDFFHRLNAIGDPSLELLERKLRARPRHVKFALYIERELSA